MLDLSFAINNIKLIISKIKGCMINRDFFENALYDCFDNFIDIENIMAGYDYFAPLIKKPKFDTAVSVIAKKSNLHRDYIKMICEIWMEAKFSGNTEQFIVDTVKFNEDYLRTDEDDFESDNSEAVFTSSSSSHSVYTMKESIPISTRRSIYVSSSRNSASNTTQSQISARNGSQKAAPVTSLYNSGYREMPSSKLYKKITGRDTVLDNRYSSIEKIGLVFLFIFGIVLSIIFTYFFVDKQMFLIRTIILCVLYLSIGVFLYIVISRNKDVTTPMRWAIVLTACMFLILVFVYKLVDIIEMSIFKGYDFFKDIVFIYAIFIQLIIYKNISKNEDKMKKLLTAIITGSIIVPILICFSIFVISFILKMTGNGLSTNFYIATICMGAFVVYNFIESRFFSGKYLNNILVSTCLYFVLFIYVVLISFLSFLYNESIPWYYVITLSVMLLAGVYVIFMSRRRIGTVYSWITLFVATTIAVFLSGAIYAIFSLFIKQESLIILKIILSFILSCVALLGLRISLSRYFGSVFKK